jgi:hypothetical protein
MKFIQKSLCALFSTCLLNVAAFAQSDQNGTADRNKPLDAFAVKQIDTLIYVQVSINGSENKLFLLDSGASFWLIDASVAKTLNLKTDGTGSVQGAGAGRVAVTYTRDVTFSLPGIKTRVPKVTVVNLSGSNPAIAGIIGYDFFKQYVVQINYHTNYVRLYDPKTFDYRGPGTVIPINFKGKQIYINGKIKVAGKDTVSKDYLVDTGSSDILNDDIIGESTSDKKVVTGGVGLGKTFKIQIGYADKFQMGNLAFSHVNCATGGQKIGAGLFCNYVVTLDYYHRKMIIE